MPTQDGLKTETRLANWVFSLQIKKELFLVSSRLSENIRKKRVSIFTSLAGAGLYENCFNVWNSGKYTKRRDDYERGTAGQWDEFGPIVDAHSWGSGCSNCRPKVRLPKHPIFNAFLRSTLNPHNAMYQLQSPSAPLQPLSLRSLHHITVKVTNQEISCL